MEQEPQANALPEQANREKREEKRFEKQLERELKRGRLSWKTKNALEERDLLQFGRSVLQEKTNNAKLQDSQPSAQESAVQLSTTRTQVVGSASEPLPPRVFAQTPQSLPSEIVRVCIDGRQAEMRVYGGIIRFLD